MTNLKKIKLGTRGSPLALAQTEMVKAKLKALDPAIEIETVIIKTSGDWTQAQGETPLAEIQSTGQWAGKGLFTKEIQQALLDGRIDAAIHSMKDVESFTPKGLITQHMLEREDPRDSIILRDGLKATSIDDIPKGSTIGTSSIRRAAFLKHKRPDLETTPIRGNVQTRLDKLHKNAMADALFLATAGLKRLGLEQHISFTIDPDILLPSAGQGAVGIEIREDNEEIIPLLNAISCNTTTLCVLAERAAIKELGGNCSTPIGAHAAIDENGTMHLTTAIASEDGAQYWEKTTQAAAKTKEESTALGLKLGQELRQTIPQQLLPESNR